MTNTKLSKESFTQMKAIACIGIVISHAINANDPTSIKWLACGYLWVGVFFFMSGYGFVYSFTHRNNYLNNVLKNKFCKVYIPFMFAELVFMVVDGQIMGTGIGEIIQMIIGLKLANTVLWYVVEIIVFWLLSVLLLKIDRLSMKTYVISMVVVYIAFLAACVVFDVGNWWYLSTSCLILGVAWSSIQENVIKCLNSRLISYALAILTIIGFISQYIIGLHQTVLFGISTNYMVTGIRMIIIPLFSLMLTLGWHEIIDSKFNNVLSFVGGYRLRYICTTWLSSKY